MILFSPAKLNLFFRVIKKREDGFHEIVSRYQVINLGDRLTLEHSEKESFSCSDSHLPCDESNLVRKAVSLFRQKTGKTTPIRCHLEKNIPIGGGFGGGSSNAAAALYGMNELAGGPATLHELSSWSRELGSDVPFFFSQGSALCTGRGEKVQEIKSAVLTDLWVASPPFGVSTAKVFQNVYLHHPNNQHREAPEFLGADCLDDGDTPSFFNDLELAAFTVEPKLKEIKHSLELLGFDKVVMTGSGSSFFCIGNPAFGSLPGIRFFKVECIARHKGGWYEQK
jgi:4-diphosphocytidyl-2-C-methyl-D-erythritol kinase